MTRRPASDLSRLISELNPLRHRSHDKVIAAVLEGRVDASAIYDGALGVAKRSGVPQDGQNQEESFTAKDHHPSTLQF